MPKEKVTRGKGKATKAEGGKKKKGKLFACSCCPQSMLTSEKTPTRPSVVSLPTCSSPTSSARRSVRTTPVSSSVSLLLRNSNSNAIASNPIQVRSASSSARSGRLCPRSSVPHTRPRLPPTRSGTKRRRPLTKYASPAPYTSLYRPS
jgi:hypothetical protein